MQQRLVCVVGSLNTDTTYTLREIPAAGETILADSRLVSHGGKGANQSAAAAVSGGRVGFIAAVGDDEDGVAAVNDLAALGIDVVGVARSPRQPTGSAVILVSDGGENVIVVDPGANRTLDPVWTAEHVRRLDPAVVLGQLEIPYTALAAAAEASPTATFVLNPAPMPATVADLGALLALADVLVPNRAELGQLAGRPEPTTSAAVDDCAAAVSFVGALIVTLGADGAVVYVGGRRTFEMSAADVSAIDTSGAGDAFCGGLAHRLALGDTIESAVRWATELAGASTTHRGARLASTSTAST